MNRNMLALASAALVAAMIMIAVLIAGVLPSGAVLPVHWGPDGRADIFDDKWTALLMPAVVTAAVALLFYFLPSLEPRKQGFERSQGLYLWGWVSLLMLGFSIQLAVISVALGWRVQGTSFIVGGIGVMFAIIGNQLGKSRRMYLTGFRTPWTLASEEVWIKTHRLAGKLMVAGGLLLIIAALIPLRPGFTAALLLAVVSIGAGVPCLYSYLLWRREQRA